MGVRKAGTSILTSPGVLVTAVPKESESEVHHGAPQTLP